MALWQFVMDLIPASAANVAGVAAARMNRDQLDRIDIGLTRESISSISGMLEALLPEKEPWSSDLRIWGDENTNDVQVWFEEQSVECFQFRIDVSDLPISLVGGICALARKLDCLLATRDGAIVQPNSEAVIRCILNSSAAHYVNDPRAFLERAIRLDKDEI